MELILSRDAKNNDGLYKYVSQKRKVKESAPSPMSKTGKLVTIDEQNSEVLHNYFASVFIGNLSSHTSLMDRSQGKDKGTKFLPTEREGS